MYNRSLSASIALASLTVGLTLSGAARAAFLEDSKLSLGLRNYYYNPDNRSGGPDQKEWAGINQAMFDIDHTADRCS